MARKSNKKNNVDTSKNETAIPQTNGVEGQESTEIPIEGNEGEVEMDVEVEGKEMTEIEQLQSVILKTTVALAEAKEQNLRLNADFANFRKRKDKEVSDVVKFASQDLIIKILPVLDNFDRTLKAIEETDNLTAIKEGIEGVSRNMRNILTRIGLEPIETAGAKFDSEIHEAVTTIPAPEEAQKGKVIDEIEKGYRLKDKIIRFPKVVVGE